MNHLKPRGARTPACSADTRVGARWSACATLLLLVSAASAQPAPGTGSIEGRVVNSLTGAPVRKASVELSLLTGPRQPQPLGVESDAEGRFQFTALPAGRYLLSAQRPGFLNQFYLARHPNTPGPAITLGANGHLTGADLRLLPQGVITGRVVDEDGDPMAGAQVLLLKQSYRDGRKRWDQINSMWTIDTGEYRLPNIAPGRYLVEIVSRRAPTSSRYGGDPAAPDKPEMVYPALYYPNVSSEQAASPVEVAAGADVQGIDIHMFRSPSFHVRGALTGVPQGARNVFVGLYSAEGGIAPLQADVEPPDYRFDVRGVLPGQYHIEARGGSGPGQTSAWQTITVAANITDLVLPLAPPLNLTGQIRIAEAGAQVKLDGVFVNLRPVGNPFLNGQPGGRSDAAGKLGFPLPFPAGRYAVSLQNTPENCYLKAVKIGGEEVPADNLEILNAAPIEVVLSSTAGKITGSVLDKDGKPASNATVVLVPEKNAASEWATSNDSGGFTFNRLPPGTYKLYAWEDVERGAWEDPDFRQLYDDRAAEIAIGPGETQNAQLKLIPAEEMK